VPYALESRMKGYMSWERASHPYKQSSLDLLVYYNSRVSSTMISFLKDIV